MGRFLTWVVAITLCFGVLHALRTCTPDVAWETPSMSQLR